MNDWLSNGINEWVMEWMNEKLYEWVMDWMRNGVNEKFNE